MAADPAAEGALIAACLAHLQPDAPPIRGYTLLQGGLSGSRVYRVTTAGGSLVLKMTPATASATALQRARREIAFYRHLAARLPLAVPRVRASAPDSPGGPALLLAAYRPPQPPDAWDTPSYITAARQLARLHAAFWDALAQLARWPWLRPAPPAAPAAGVAVAWQAWQDLLAHDHLALVLTAPVLDRIGRLLAGVAVLEAAVRTLPPTLCHGDCHTGNLFHDADGQLVWADWQEVGVGRGPEDLAFLFQRALMAGGAVAEAPIIAAYSEALAAATGTSLAPATVERVLCSSELHTRLLAWPAYLGQVTAAQMESMVARIAHLAERLGLG